MENTNRPRPSADGDGWLLDYVCQLIARFPSFDAPFVWDALPMVEGWAYYQWAINNDPVSRIFGGERKGKSFISQEVDRLVEQAINADERWKE